MRIDQLTFKQPIFTTLFGFFVYDLGKFISIFSNYENFLRAFGLILIIVGLSRCKLKKRHQVPIFIRKFLFLYQIWLIILTLGTIIRVLFHYDSMPLNVEGTLRYFAFFEHSPFVHFFPLVLRIDWDISLLNKFWRLGVFFLAVNGIILFLFSSFIFYGLTNQGQTTLESASAETGFYHLRELLPLIILGNAFMGIRYNLIFYNKKSFMLLFFLYNLLIYVLTIASGSRGALIMGLLGLLTPFFVSINNRFRLIISLISFIFIFIFLFRIFNSEIGQYTSDRLFEDKRSLKLNESTREFYTESMIEDFNANPLDYLFGRGAFGVYTLHNSNEQRPDIEWGFLWFILKGGYAYLLLYLLFNLYAFYLGLFKANNAYCKVIGYVALLKVIALFPFGIPSFGFGLFSGTMISGLLFYSNFRNLNNKQLKAIIVGGK